MLSCVTAGSLSASHRSHDDAKVSQSASKAPESSRTSVVHVEIAGKHVLAHRCHDMAFTYGASACAHGCDTRSDCEYTPTSSNGALLSYQDIRCATRGKHLPPTLSHCAVTAGFRPGHRAELHLDPNLLEIFAKTKCRLSLGSLASKHIV